VRLVPNKQEGGIQMQMGDSGAPNNEWQDVQYGFNGKWIPDVDPALIGPDNFAILQNLRYNDSALEGISGYTKWNSSIVALGDYVKIRSGIQLRLNQELDIPSYTLFRAEDPSGNGKVFVSTSDIDGNGTISTTYPLQRVAGTDNNYVSDTGTFADGRFANAPQGSIAYHDGSVNYLFSGQEQRISAVFLVDDVYPSTTLVRDRTDALSKATTTDTVTIEETDSFLIFTTRPAQGFKFYVSSYTGANHTITVKYWDGDSFAAVTNVDDDTAQLTTTGTYRFDMPTDAAPHHFEELYLYAYQVLLTDGATGNPTSTIYHITCDLGFNQIVDVWDGVYRQPITFQKWDGTSWADYTLYVNEPSTDLSSPIGAEIGGLAAGAGDASGSRIEIMFDEPQSAIRVQMVAGFTNTNAAELSLFRWEGTGFVSVGTPLQDDTATSGVALDKTGFIWWVPDTSAIEKVTKFGVTGYLYALEWDDQLEGASAGTDPEDVIVDIITGIPAQTEVPPFKWSAEFNNRLFMGNYNIGREANRVDFSVANAPDVWNGFESSMNGLQSLFIGGDEPTVGGVQIYNRFGASVYSMFLIFKATELYLLAGDSPEDFIVYPVSRTVGCPAPYTIATAELGMDIGENVSRNIALWLSHSGVMMFDGATLYKIPGIRNYFDPNDSAYIEWETMSRARGWFDTVYKEYNLLIPSTSGVSENNVWLVYDLERKKWYSKSTGIAATPQAAWPCVADTGENFVFAGTDDGYVMKLEVGQSWSGVGIRQVIKTGDFWPSKNIWDETLLRKFRLICRKFPDTANEHNLEIFYFNNTDTISGIGTSWAESSVAAGIAVDFEDTDDVEWVDPATTSLALNVDVGLQRTIRLVQDFNYRGWAHAFQFEVTTDDITKGLQPIIWGLRYRIERKDDTAT
jgi:hypothetical protein